MSIVNVARHGGYMAIIQNLLTVNPYSRSGKKLISVKAIVMHWTGNPNVDALANRNYWEFLKDGKNGYASAHYIVGLNGNIIQAIPTDEMAYHCGTSKGYTQYAKEKFREYCINPILSPNLVTIGIEMCPMDLQGHFNVATTDSAQKLVASLLKQFNLGVDDITYHSAIIGTSWKKCPLLWVNEPSRFDEFKAHVGSLIA